MKIIIFISIAILGMQGTSFAAEIPLSLKCLWSSYPVFKITADRRDIVFPDGTQLPFENRDPAGTPADRANLTSLDQIFLSPYPQGLTFPTPTQQDDLRGARFTAFNKKIYGASEAAVRKNLVRLQWVDGSWVQFTPTFGAAAALEKVIVKLKVLLKQKPDYKKYLKQPLGGTFEWRTVAGEPNNLSMHSFGVAIDINTDFTDYWRWDMGRDGKVPAWRNKIPPEIAVIFEEEGFIWGGKWYRYDTMHFEFRPELLMSAQDCQTKFENYRD